MIFFNDFHVSLYALSVLFILSHSDSFSLEDCFDFASRQGSILIRLISFYKPWLVSEIILYIEFFISVKYLSLLIV